MQSRLPLRHSSKVEPITWDLTFCLEFLSFGWALGIIYEKPRCHVRWNESLINFILCFPLCCVERSSFAGSQIWILPSSLNESGVLGKSPGGTPQITAPLHAGVKQGVVLVPCKVGQSCRCNWKPDAHAPEGAIASSSGDLFFSFPRSSLTGRAIGSLPMHGAQGGFPSCPLNRITAVYFVFCLLLLSGYLFI